MLTVLSIACPLTPVGDPARCWAHRSPRSLVVACRASKVTGRLLDVARRGYLRPTAD
jgi:hypothetical protein